MIIEVRDPQPKLIQKAKLQAQFAECITAIKRSHGKIRRGGPTRDQQVADLLVPLRLIGSRVMALYAGDGNRSVFCLLRPERNAEIEWYRSEQAAERAARSEAAANPVKGDGLKVAIQRHRHDDGERWVEGVLLALEPMEANRYTNERFATIKIDGAEERIRVQDVYVVKDSSDVKRLNDALLAERGTSAHRSRLEKAMVRLHGREEPADRLRIQKLVRAQKRRR